VFHLIGPTQVGLGSFSGMRLLHRARRLALWPWDPPARRGLTIVELFTRTCLVLAGATRRKIRTHDDLNAALARLGARPHRGTAGLSDHATDALIAAAALRRMTGERRYWQPGGLSDKVRATEGWTFGVP